MKKVKGLLLGMVVVLGVSVGIDAPLHADEYIYKSTNKIDYIKIKKAKKSEKEGGLNHPYTFDPDQIRAILGSIHFNKKILLLKDVENRKLYDDANVEFLAPYLMEAFRKVDNNQVVVVSYFTRDSKVVIHNDRLTIFRAYVKDDGLHIKFTKMYAKLLGDKDTQGAERVAAQARQMRVNLELQPGQNRISWDPEELVFDLAYFASGGQVVVQDGAKNESPAKKSTQNPTRKNKVSKDSDQAERSIRDRLKELDQLRQDELITEKEYESKRRELLKEL